MVAYFGLLAGESRADRGGAIIMIQVHTLFQPATSAAWRAVAHLPLFPISYFLIPDS